MNISSVVEFISEYSITRPTSFEFILDFPMSECCSFRIGGRAKIAVLPKNCEAFEAILSFVTKKDIPFKVLGNGTNILPSDIGFDGALILTKKLSAYSFDGNLVYAECGVNLTRLAKKAYEHSLSGMENFYGIPATIGGAVYMNAGAYNSQISDVLTSAKCYNHKTNKIETYTNEQLVFSYRHSLCQREPLTVISASFSLKGAESEGIITRMNEVLTKRKSTQPLEFPNAGSVFKRPLNNYAGKLIDEAGLKGYRIGDAEVSEKHAGFIINRGSATAEDVILLIEHIKQRVFEKSGIILECEIECI